MECQKKFLFLISEVKTRKIIPNKKYSKAVIMKTQLLREEFTSRLKELNGPMLPKDRAKVAVELDLNAKSVDNYLGGLIANIETAERIIIASEKVLSLKEELKEA